MNLFMREHNFGPKKFEEWTGKNKTLWGKLEKYFPKYIKGSIVKSVRNSPGIMCFGTYSEATSFIESFWDLSTDNCRIIRVKGIGKKTEAKEILHMRSMVSLNTDLSKLIKNKEYITKIGYKIEGDKKTRVCRKCGEAL